MHIWKPYGSLEVPPLPLPARRARAANAPQVPGQRENVSLTQARKGCRRVLLDPLVSDLSRERVRGCAWPPIVGGLQCDVLADGSSRSTFPMV